MKIPRAEDFGRQNAAETFRFEFEKDMIVEHSGGMNNSAKRRHRVANFGKRARNIAFVRYVASHALRRQFHFAFSSLARSSLAVEVPLRLSSTRCLAPFSESHRATDSPRPPLPPVIRYVASTRGAAERSVEVLRFISAKRNDNFPDIFSAGHVTKTVCRVFHGKNIVRQWFQASLLKHGHQFQQERTEQIGALTAHAFQIKSKIGKVVAEREKSQRLVLIDICFPDFDKSAVWRQAWKGCGLCIRRAGNSEQRQRPFRRFSS